jgi:ferredoxin-type protein NapH
VILAVVSAVGKSGTGNLCAFGYRSISIICPLGTIEAAIVDHHIAPRAVLSLVMVAITIVLLGRAFCGWLCPVPRVQRWFSGGEDSRAPRELQCSATGQAEQEKNLGARTAARNWRLLTLGAVLLSTAVVGIPVFCLICPIGLTFASLIALWRLLHFNEPTWALIVYPLVVLVEVTFFKRWCGKFCPLGALIWLIGSLNVTFRPKIDSGSCLRYKGINCQACIHACPEGLSLLAQEDAHFAANCRRCLECSDACPEHAVTFPFFHHNGQSLSVCEGKKLSHGSRE